jgi:hypothetical protein
MEVQLFSHGLNHCLLSIRAVRDMLIPINAVLETAESQSNSNQNRRKEITLGLGVQKEQLDGETRHKSLQRGCLTTFFSSFIFIHCLHRGGRILSQQGGFQVSERGLERGVRGVGKGRR